MNNKSIDFVNVSVRIKPNFKEVTSSLEVINNDPPILLVLDKAQMYHFDNIFTTEVNQKHVYNETVKPLVDYVKNGYNCTVFAYGQTGTGKTYTMGTNPEIKNEEDMGLISRTLEDLFCLTNDDEEVEIYISFIEIYNEKVFDLLNHNKVPLSIKGFTVHGYEKVRIFETSDALSHLTQGGRNRHTGETKQNFNSSRSHAIFTIHYSWRDSQKEITSKLNLVDLAGSESVRKTGNQGNSLNEGININKGLLSLGQVMTALSNNSTHVPYRQSVLTTILQDSLNKKNYVSLIACVSSNIEDSGETLQTLEFSQRVKKIKNKPEINHVITQYRRENPQLMYPRGSTPLKRSFDNMSYETPFKKHKFPMPVIPEPSSSINSLDCSKSSCSSVCDNVQQHNCSPVIKKYLNAMEESLVNKLQGVIQNTLRRSTRNRSLNKENITSPSTPSFSWDKVAKIVRSEVLQLTSHHSRATSTPSPIEKWPKSDNSLDKSKEEPRFKPKKLWVDDTSSLSSDEKDINEEVFKVPEPIQKRRKFVQSPVKRRSSVRLQIKKMQDDTRRSIVMVDTKKQQEESVQRRRSVRLQMKTENDKKYSDEDKSVPKQQRINRKSTVKKLTKKSHTVDQEGSPVTVRTKQVLKIINSGSIRDIATLHTIGAKTAEKILLFWQLKGNFKTISELSKMPYWTKNKYDKFLAENFLRDE